MPLPWWEYFTKKVVLLQISEDKHQPRGRKHKESLVADEKKT